MLEFDTMVNETYKKKNGDVVINYICRPCNAERHLKWYYDHKDQALEYNRRYIAKKKEQKLVDRR